MTIVAQERTQAKAPPERTLSDVFDAVTQLRDDVNVLWEKLAPIALYQPRDPEAHLSEECRAHTCGYDEYRSWNTTGERDLPHEAYDAHERLYEQHYKSCGRYEKGERCPVCEGFEKRLRA